MSETFEQMAIRKWQEVCKSLSVGAPVAIKFASAIRDELAKGAKPVAYCDDAVISGKIGNAASISAKEYWGKGNWADLREIAKRLCHPLYSFPPSAAARIAELEKQRDALLGDVERCYRMLLSDPDTKGALFKAENILREAIAQANEVAA